MKNFLDIAYKEEVVYQHKYINVSAIAEIDVDGKMITMCNGHTFVVSEESLQLILAEVGIN